MLLPQKIFDNISHILDLLQDSSNYNVYGEKTASSFYITDQNDNEHWDIDIRGSCITLILDDIPICENEIKDEEYNVVSDNVINLLTDLENHLDRECRSKFWLHSQIEIEIYKKTLEIKVTLSTLLDTDISNLRNGAFEIKKSILLFSDMTSSNYGSNRSNNITLSEQYSNKEFWKFVVDTCTKMEKTQLEKIKENKEQLQLSEVQHSKEPVSILGYLKNLIQFS